MSRTEKPSITAAWRLLCILVDQGYAPDTQLEADARLWCETFQAWADSPENHAKMTDSRRCAGGSGGAGSGVLAVEFGDEAIESLVEIGEEDRFGRQVARRKSDDFELGTIQYDRQTARWCGESWNVAGQLIFQGKTRRDLLKQMLETAPRPDHCTRLNGCLRFCRCSPPVPDVVHVDSENKVSMAEYQLLVERCQELRGREVELEKRVQELLAHHQDLVRSEGDMAAKLKDATYEIGRLWQTIEKIQSLAANPG